VRPASCRLIGRQAPEKSLRSICQLTPAYLTVVRGENLHLTSKLQLHRVEAYYLYFMRTFLGGVYTSLGALGYEKDFMRTAT